MYESNPYTSDFMIPDFIQQASLHSLHAKRNLVNECSAIAEPAEKIKFVAKHLDKTGFLDYYSTEPLKVMKNDRMSEEGRVEGNKLYAKSKYVAAVAYYNESLCFAESPKNLALIYGNRSAVCFMLKMYSTCLRNIELAQSHGYPDDKKHQLDARAEKCRQMIAEGAETDEKLLKPSGEEFLNLSHPPHPKLPYVSNCLDVTFNDKFGRHVITKKKLLPGEIVCIEPPFSRYIGEFHKIKYCIHCMENNFLSFIPCEVSTSAMFCSQKCKDEAFEPYNGYQYKVEILDDLYRLCSNPLMHSIEMFLESVKVCSGDMEKLRAAYETGQNNPELSILEVDNPSDPVNVLQAVGALKTQKQNDKFIMMRNCETIAIIVDLFLKHTTLVDVLKTEDDQDLFREMLYRNMLIAMINCKNFGLCISRKFNSEKHVSSSGGCFPFMAMLNHSCAANVARLSDNKANYLIVTRVIEPGQQLFDKYYGHYTTTDRSARQKLLKEKYMFECKCEACVNNYPKAEKLQTKISDTKSQMKIMQLWKMCLQAQIVCVDVSIAKKVFKQIQSMMVDEKHLFPCMELCAAEKMLDKCFEMFFMSKLQLHLSKTE